MQPLASSLTMAELQHVAGFPKAPDSSSCVQCRVPGFSLALWLYSLAILLDSGTGGPSTSISLSLTGPKV